MSADYAPRTPDQEESAEVIPLGHAPVPEAPPSRPGKWHALAISGMAICALVGIAAMLALITVSWTEDLRAIVIGVFVMSGVGFMAFASIAVLSAARDTYPRRHASSGEPPTN